MSSDALQGLRLSETRAQDPQVLRICWLKLPLHKLKGIGNESIVGKNQLHTLEWLLTEKCQLSRCHLITSHIDSAELCQLLPQVAASLGLITLVQQLDSPKDANSWSEGEEGK
eukprot:3841679-Amphidinium_carterae.1